ncbi:MULTISPECIES: hypothetical protein [unclassified Paenibacillus]|uniref:hypothetical protein n=1 Tax=unclassified Paenibacillus TaxID=185978 RepID=UPI00070B5007|nr:MULTISPECIES: hypothetical protein [unclassified Paenibacillus]KQX48552.1 hypothetical protein ASD40_10180 [Paenibacillus sp. Root444D2]KRE49830.1 hypothetical protein ASG85_23450 [Paenibacillus sp. Soil724D2]
MIVRAIVIVAGTITVCATSVLNKTEAAPECYGRNCEKSFVESFAKLGLRDRTQAALFAIYYN